MPDACMDLLCLDRAAVAHSVKVTRIDRDQSIADCTNAVDDALQYMIAQGYTNSAAYNSVIRELGQATLEGNTFLDAFVYFANDAAQLGTARVRTMTTTYAQNLMRQTQRPIRPRLAICRQQPQA